MDSVNSGGGGSGHTLAASKDYPFECQFCETLYKSMDAYTSHMEAHETLFTYDHICTVCSKQFVCADELQLHSRLHADLKPYKCKMCSQAFRLARSLEYHLLGHGGGPRAYLCTMCDATFVQLADIHEHLRDHQLGRVKVQQQQQQQRAKATPAVVVADPDEESDEGEAEDGGKYVPCPELELTTHSHDSAETSLLADVECVVAVGERSSRRTNASADGTGASSHVKAEGVAEEGSGHRRATATNGDGGGGGGRDENDEYDEEAVFARAVNVKKTLCNLCNKKMATRKSLNTHYKSVHMKNAHTCTVCRTSFLFSRLLEEHTRRRKRIIPCEFCDLRFCSNKRWDSHIAKHRADSVAAPSGGVIMYPRAVPLSSTGGGGGSRQSQQANISNAAATAINHQSNSNNNNNFNTQRQSLLKNNHNNNNNHINTSSAASPSSSPAALMMRNRVAQQQQQSPVVNLIEGGGGGSPIGKFPCDSCGKIFLSLHYLQAHLVKRRNPNFQFQCDVCEHRFSKKAILDEHRVYHERQAAKKVVPRLVINKQRATINGYEGDHNNHHSTSTLSTSSANPSRRARTREEQEEMDYDRHIIKLSDQSFKCNCCHRTFKAVNHLKCHLRYTHMKKNFKCRSCNQQFPFYKLYLAHMKHSKLCERCDKRICAKVSVCFLSRTYRKRLL